MAVGAHPSAWDPVDEGCYGEEYKIVVHHKVLMEADHWPAPIEGLVERAYQDGEYQIIERRTCRIQRYEEYILYGESSEASQEMALSERR